MVTAAFGPDAEVSSLVLTIPLSLSSIERTRRRADLSIVSYYAKYRLMDALQSLQDSVEEMITAIKEDES